MINPPSSHHSLCTQKSDTMSLPSYTFLNRNDHFRSFTKCHFFLTVLIIDTYCTWPECAFWPMCGHRLSARGRCGFCTNVFTSAGRQQLFRVHTKSQVGDESVTRHSLLFLFAFYSRNGFHCSRKKVQAYILIVKSLLHIISVKLLSV